MLEQALLYGEKGWAVFPVNGKKPAIKEWKTKASTDHEKIKKLFKVRHTGIGLATGKISGITVVDIDKKEGVDGFLTLTNLGVTLPPTISSLTPSGGRHYFYKYDPCLKNVVGIFGDKSGIDIRNDGGLVVLPPSKYSDLIYSWAEGRAPAESELTDFPKDFLNLLKLRQAENDGPFELPSTVQTGNRNGTLFKYACQLRREGKNEGGILSALLKANVQNCIEPLPEGEVATIAKRVSSYNETNTKSNAKLPKKSLRNIVRIMNTDENLVSLFYLNLFTRDVLYSRDPLWSEGNQQGKTLCDRDFILVKYYLATNYQFEAKAALIDEAVIVSAFQKKRHPVREYLESLKWDGTSRLKNWLSVVAGVTDNIYTNCVGKKTLVAAVARVYQPGVKFDNMLILEGDQGLGKSTLVKILAGDWFAAVPITDRDKDTIDIMRGVWIAEVEEMVCFKREDLEHVKAFLSRQTDKVRLAYRRNSEEFQRQCIFIGTMNPVGDKDYLRDQSGNRRFWPVTCTKKIDRDWLIQNRDQLFAEALQSYKNGETLWIDDPNIEPLIRREQEIRQNKDVWTGVIARYLEDRSSVSAKDILTDCLDIDVGKVSKSDQTRVGIIMRQLGWVKEYNVDARCGIYYSPSTEQ